MTAGMAGRIEGHVPCVVVYEQETELVVG